MSRPTPHLDEYGRLMRETDAAVKAISAVDMEAAPRQALADVRALWPALTRNLRRLKELHAGRSALILSAEARSKCVAYEPADMRRRLAAFDEFVERFTPILGQPDDAGS